jgi:nucleoside-diphosphate-sugar epimerase
MLIELETPILVTGAGGFIGSRVVQSLIGRGFRNVRCLVRSTEGCAKLEADLKSTRRSACLQVLAGNLLSKKDCMEASQGVAVIYHLAAGSGAKSFPDAFLNSVVTTRNLLEAAGQHGSLRRFVNVSSLSVYAASEKRGRLLNESCPVETHPQRRGDAYCFAKVKQDEIVAEYARKFNIPYVILRPGVVYGPGKVAIHGRIGIAPFGLFLHLGGSNPIPFTYVENCAEEIVLAGITPGLDAEVFNIVDDDLPSSRCFLSLYKKEVRSFRSVYVPHALSYLLCWLWESYSRWSQGQLPPAFNRAAWHSYWKRSCYSNEKVKRCLGWTPKIPLHEGLMRYFENCRQEHA